MLGADDDQSGIVDALAPQFGDDPSECLVDEIKLRSETRGGFAENAYIAAIYRRPVCYDRAVLQFLADADGLIVEAEKRGDCRALRAIVREAVDLVDHSLHVEQVVALDVAEVGGPAVVESVVDLGHWIATRKLRKRYWIRIDLRSVKIIHTCAAWAIRPFIGGVLIDPGRGAAIGFDYFENRVDLQILMREDRGAIFGRGRAEENLD